MASRKKPLQSRTIGCLHCGHTDAVLPMDSVLYQGFGGYSVWKDGKLFYCAPVVNDPWHDSRVKRLKDIEKRAKREARHDWEVRVDMPLRSAVYQRQRGKWMLVETGRGFA